MKISVNKIGLRARWLIGMAVITLLGVTMFSMQPAYADGNAESSFQWKAKAAATEPWATPIDFSWVSTLGWEGDSYYSVALDGYEVPEVNFTSAWGSIAGAATITILVTGNHELCVSTNSYSSAWPEQHCVAFAIAGEGDSNYEAAKAEAQSLAAPEVQKAFEDCGKAAREQNYAGDINDFCNRSSAVFKGNLERWYQCRYGTSMLFDVPYDHPRITELCGNKPVYKIPTFRSSGSDSGVS